MKTTYLPVKQFYCTVFHESVFGSDDLKATHNLGINAEAVFLVSYNILAAMYIGESIFWTRASFSTDSKISHRTSKKISKSFRGVTSVHHAI